MHIKAKKFLGQHFLKNRKILEEMARAAKLTKKDVVLEVGPGTGTLTSVLAGRAGKVVTVEKDSDLIPALLEKFRDNRNVKVIEGDIFNPLNPPYFKGDKINAHLKVRGARGVMKYKIVANIPYYITSRFLRIFLENKKLRPELMILMIQREVAERICAQPPHMNLLALSVQAYAKPEIIRKVSKNFFSPPPKVDSAIIRIITKPHPTLSFVRRGNKKTIPFPLTTACRLQLQRWRKGEGAGVGGFDIEKVLHLARLAFQQKRKMLKHSLKSILSTSDVDRFGYKRPQELSLNDWLAIYKNINL